MVLIESILIVYVSFIYSIIDRITVIVQNETAINKQGTPNTGVMIFEFQILSKIQNRLICSVNN